MTAEPPRSGKDPTGRQARLRDALRDNLKRRKLQARGRADQAAGSADQHGENVQDSRRIAAEDIGGGEPPKAGGERR